MSDDDDDLPPPNPLPLFVGHMLGVLLHGTVGASTIAMMLFGPALHPAAGDPLTQTRIWLAGIAGFSTVFAIFFSTITALMCYRLLSLFLAKSSSTTIRIGMLTGVLVAHSVGCTAGVIGSAAAVGGTLFGEHGGPWTVRTPDEP